MKIELGRLAEDGNHGSSSTCLKHEDEMMRIQLGSESMNGDTHQISQRIIHISLKKPYYSDIFIGEKETDFACLSDEIKADNYKFVLDYAINLITARLHDPEEMTKFVEKISSDSYDNGWKKGRNNLRDNLGKLLFTED
jgi:hypothetical protein